MGSTVPIIGFTGGAAALPDFADPFGAASTARSSSAGGSSADGLGSGFATPADQGGFAAALARAAGTRDTTRTSSTGASSEKAPPSEGDAAAADHTNGDAQASASADASGRAAQETGSKTSGTTDAQAGTQPSAAAQSSAAQPAGTQPAAAADAAAPAASGLRKLVEAAQKLVNALQGQSSATDATLAGSPLQALQRLLTELSAALQGASGGPGVPALSQADLASLLAKIAPSLAKATDGAGKLSEELLAKALSVDPQALAAVQALIAAAQAQAAAIITPAIPAGGAQDGAAAGDGGQPAQNATPLVATASITAVQGSAGTTGVVDAAAVKAAAAEVVQIATTTGEAGTTVPATGTGAAAASAIGQVADATLPTTAAAGAVTTTVVHANASTNEVVVTGTQVAELKVAQQAGANPVAQAPAADVKTGAVQAASESAPAANAKASSDAPAANASATDVQAAASVTAATSDGTASNQLGGDGAFGEGSPSGAATASRSEPRATSASEATNAPVMAAPTVGAPAVPTEATAAPAEAAVSVQDLNDQLAPQIVRQARLVSVGGAHEMTLRLEPGSLGTVHIRLSLSESGLSVGLLAANENTHRTLEAALPQLRATLADAGVRLQRLDLGFGDTASGSGNDGQRDFSGNGFGGRSNGSAGDPGTGRQSGGQNQQGAETSFTSVLFDQDGRPFDLSGTRGATSLSPSTSPTTVTAAALLPVPGTIALSRGGYGAYGALPSDRVAARSS